MDISLAVGLAVTESDNNFIGHAFVVLVVFAVRHFTGADTRGTAYRFGVSGRIGYGKKRIRNPGFVRRRL